MFGAELELAPAGTLVTSNGNNASTSTDLTNAVGVGVSALYAFTPNLAAGVAPRFLTHIKGADATNSDTSNFFDLRAMIEGRFPVASQIHILVYGALGYGIVDLPGGASSGFVTTSNPSGATLSFAAGAAFTVAPNTAITAMLGYEVGFESATVTVLGFTGSGDAQYDHVILGVGVRVGM